MGTAIDVGTEITSASHLISHEMLVAFERVIWTRVANVHNDPAAAQRVGMARTIASGQNQLAILHQMMEEHFGDGWVRGGKIAARWVCPVYVDDTITPYGRIMSTESIEGRQRVEIAIWCQNQTGAKTGTGTAHAFVGSPRL